MALRTITVNLDLNGQSFQVGLKAAEKDIQAFIGQTGKMDAAMKRSEWHTRSWARVLRDSFIVLGLARSAIHNVTAAFGALPKAVMQASGEIERMTVLMASLDRDSNSTAEAIANAEQQVKKLFSIAANSPFSVGAITDSFVKLKAAGLDPSAGALEGLVNAVAKFGGTSEQLKRASIAIQQMAGKGVISMEELRQQLGEAVPNAMMMMARAAGMSMSKMVKIISSGQMEAQSALRALNQQMVMETMGSAAQLAKTWQGSLNRLNNAWTLFLADIGKRGVFDEAKKQLNDLILAIQDSMELKNFAAQIGVALTEAIIALRDFVDYLLKIREELALIGKIMAVAFAAHFMHAPLVLLANFLMSIQNISVSMRAMAPINAALQAQFAAINTSIRSATISMGLWSGSVALAAKQQGVLVASSVAMRGALAGGAAALRGLAAAAGAFGRALAFINPYIGLIITAVWAAVEVWRYFNKEVETSNELLEKHSDLITDTEAAHLQGSLRAKQAALDAALAMRQRILEQNNVVSLQELIDKRFRKSERSAEGKKMGEDIRELQNALALIEKLGPEISRLSAKVEEVSFAQTGRAVEKGVREASQRLQDGLFELSVAYSKDIDAYYKEVMSHTERSEEENERIYAEGRDKRKKQLEESVAAVYNAEINALQAGGKNLSEAQRRVHDQLLVEWVAARDRQLEIIRQSNDIVQLGGKGGDQANKKAQEFASYLLSLQTRADQAMEKMGNLNKEIAKFNAMKAAGKFDSIPPEQVENARLLALELDKVNKDVKAFTKAQTLIKNVGVSIDRVKAAIQGVQAQAEDNNPFVRYAGSIVSAKQRLADYGNEIDKTIPILERLKEEYADNAEIVAQLALMMEKLKKEQGEIAEASSKADQAFSKAGFTQIDNELKKLRGSFMTTREAADFQFNEMKGHVDEFIAKAGEIPPEYQGVVDEYLALLNRQRLVSGSQFWQLMEEWRKGADDLSDVWAEAMKGMSDILMDFIFTGEASFEDFLKNIARMLVQQTVQGAFAKFAGGLVNSVLGAAAGQFGGSGLTHGAEYGASQAYFAAKGGVMTSAGPIALKRYAAGGIAREPQMAIFGEGSMPEAYVPLPDGRSIPVTLDQDSKGAKENAKAGNVTVNMINQSNTPMEAEASSPRFDGEKYVVDVIMRNLTQPGKLRDAIRGTR